MGSPTAGTKPAAKGTHAHAHILKFRCEVALAMSKSRKIHWTCKGLKAFRPHLEYCANLLRATKQSCAARRNIQRAIRMRCVLVSVVQDAFEDTMDADLYDDAGMVPAAKLFRRKLTKDTAVLESWLVLQRLIKFILFHKFMIFQYNKNPDF